MKRAREILRAIEDCSKDPKAQKQTDSSMGFDLFSSIVTSREGEVSEKIRNADINTMTPIEAMNLLFELKKMLAD